MKKYKLIETYPTIPKTVKVGTEVEWSEEMNLYHYAPTLDTFPKEEVENNPKFWDKIGEDYTILKFERVNKLIEPAVWNRTEDGFYAPEGNISPKLSLEVMLHTGISVDSGDFIIHSVKFGREIFSIGDKVEHVSGMGDWTNCKVEGFDYSKKRLRVIVRQDYATATYDLDKLKVCRKPLFKTEDGVEIYQGDECWAGHVEKGIETFEFGIWEGNSKYLQYFSTKEAAEDCVIKHKPLISVADVIKEFGDSETSGYIQRFIRIAKKNYGIL